MIKIETSHLLTKGILMTSSVTIKLSGRRMGATAAYRGFFISHGDREQAERVTADTFRYELTSPEIAKALYGFIFKWGVFTELIPVHKFLEDAGTKPPRLRLTPFSQIGWLLLNTRAVNAFADCDLTTDPTGIRTVGQLLELYEDDLVNVDGLGNGGVELVKKRVAAYGFKFRQFR
jgi:DNA-directed RNA polymerase alpha subunit